MERLINLAYGQNRILELIAGGAPLRDSLTSLLRFIEHEVPELLCSVLLLDADGLHLRHGSAPSLPPDYCRAIDGAAIDRARARAVRPRIWASRSSSATSRPIRCGPTIGSWSGRTASAPAGRHRSSGHSARWWGRSRYFKRAADSRRNPRTVDRDRHARRGHRHHQRSFAIGPFMRARNVLAFSTSPPTTSSGTSSWKRKRCGGTKASSTCSNTRLGSKERTVVVVRARPSRRPRPCEQQSSAGDRHERQQLERGLPVSAKGGASRHSRTAAT